MPRITSSNTRGASSGMSIRTTGAALKPYADAGVTCRFVSNIDPADVLEATRDLDPAETLFIASMHSYILFFTTIGKVYWIKVHELPQASRAARGKPIVNLLSAEVRRALHAQDVDYVEVFACMEAMEFAMQCEHLDEPPVPDEPRNNVCPFGSVRSRPFALSSEKSFDMTHLLRSRHDAFDSLTSRTEDRPSFA